MYQFLGMKIEFVEHKCHDISTLRAIYLCRKSNMHILHNTKVSIATSKSVYSLTEKIPEYNKNIEKNPCC